MGKFIENGPVVYSLPYESNQKPKLAMEYYQPIMSYVEQYVVGLLAEETGEVSQLVGKALRFGLDTPGVKDPLTGVVDESITPRTALEKELGDVLAAVDYATRKGVLNMEAVRQYKIRKLDKLLNPGSVDNNGKRLAP